MRPPFSKVPIPGQRQVEARRADGGERRVHLLGLPGLDLADEAQRQVVVLGRHPAGAGDAAGQGGELGLDQLGKARATKRRSMQALRKSWRRRRCGPAKSARLSLRRKPHAVQKRFDGGQHPPRDQVGALARSGGCGRAGSAPGRRPRRPAGRGRRPPAAARAASVCEHRGEVPAVVARRGWAARSCPPAAPGCCARPAASRMAVRLARICAGVRPRSPSLPPSATIAACGRSASAQSSRARPPAVVSPETPASITRTLLPALAQQRLDARRRPLRRAPGHSRR